MLEIMQKATHGTPTKAVAVMGWWAGVPGDESEYQEYDGVALLGNYGKVATAAAWSTNLSYLSAMHHAAQLLEAAVAAYRDRVAASLRIETLKTPLNRSKVYLSLGVVESGDAPAYWQYRQYRVWNDTMRGRLPVSWAMGAAVYEISPAIALHFLEQASGNDFLYAAMSGLAYAHPYRSLMGRLLQPSAAWAAYWQRTSCYLQRLGTNVSGSYTDAQKFFNRTVQDPITLGMANACERCEMLVLGMGRDDGRTIENADYELGGVHVSHVLTRWPTNFVNMTTAQDVAWLVGDIKAQLAGGERGGGDSRTPAFMQAMALSWAYGPKEIAEVVAQLPENVQLVSMQRFSQLYRAST